MHNADLIMW